LPLTPLDYGFDYAFWLDKGVSAAKWFLENRNIVKLDGEVDYGGLHPNKTPWPGHKRWQTSKYKEGEELKMLPGPDRKYIGDILCDKALEFMEEAGETEEPLAQRARHFNGDISERARQKMVYENDIILGQLREQLERLGIEDNSMIIFTSDNGAGKPGANIDGASGHYRGYKGTCWEGGHRIPLIIKWPGVTDPATTTDRLVSQVDPFATLADVIGEDKLPQKSAFDSKSFLPLLKGEDVKIRSWSFANKHKMAPYDNYRGGIQNIGATGSSGIKLLLNYLSDYDSYEVVEMYDSEEDLYETTNLIDYPAYEDKLDSLKRVFESEFDIQIKELQH